MEILKAVENELKANPDAAILVASKEFLERGTFEFHGRVEPINNGDGLWELVFIEEGAESWQ